MDTLEEEVNSLINQGIRVEEEHSQTYLWLVDNFKKGKIPPARVFFERIALRHLHEDPEYYSKLQKMEAGK